MIISHWLVWKKSYGLLTTNRCSKRPKEVAANAKKRTTTFHEFLKSIVCHRGRSKVKKKEEYRMNTNPGIHENTWPTRGFRYAFGSTATLSSLFFTLSLFTPLLTTFEIICCAKWTWADIGPQGVLKLADDTRSRWTGEWERERIKNKIK